MRLKIISCEVLCREISLLAAQSPNYVDVEFLPKGDPHVHGLRVGAGYITGLFLQWQNGVQINLWPPNLAKGKLEFPSFVKVGQAD